MTWANRTGPDEIRTRPACPIGQTSAGIRTDRTHPFRGVRLSDPACSRNARYIGCRFGSFLACFVVHGERRARFRRNFETSRRASVQGLQSGRENKSDENEIGK